MKVVQFYCHFNQLQLVLLVYIDFRCYLLYYSACEGQCFDLLKIKLLP